MTSTLITAPQPQPASPENLVKFYRAIGISAVAAALHASKADEKHPTAQSVPLHVQNFLHELAA